MTKQTPDKFTQKLSFNKDKNRIHKDQNKNQTNGLKVGVLRYLYETSQPNLHTYDKIVKDYNHGQYQSAIENTTLDLDKLTEKRLALLEIRSAAYDKEGQFDLSLHDAETILHLAPSLAVGYLRKDTIQQPGDQHQSLKDGYDQAKEQQERCVDIISQLPYELLSKIIRNLDTKSLLRFLDVSMDWERK
ncbi:hypothetical protein BDA99DRAFT_541357 [Phascolomyces articulosus]|uniref:F-box domain-containing protein n=1 Tax=Phascolomyces articulosus TaxID=60185 RepID=A0AAD5JRM9_9FUNG|nr:hypothetical protein BDA99DRAFT_541357 [Phascolomyces articulosus]